MTWITCQGGMRAAIFLCQLLLLRSEVSELARPTVMLVDVYDTTFLVGSKDRCGPSCRTGDEEECAKDLNNDDVTRFGLGQRADFGVVRDAGCPFPHLHSPSTAAVLGANRIHATIITDFSLHVNYTARGSRILSSSDFIERGEALEHANSVRAAWLVEPRHLMPHVYDQIRAEYSSFDLIFTHVREMEQLDSRFRFCPFGTTYLRRSSHRMYNKTALLSIIASRKGSDPNGGGMQGHRMRHEAIRLLEPSIQGLYADGYSTSRSGWQDNKIAGLKDYMFSIVIENIRDDCWFTEKLIDAFLTGTIPIYWGCPTIAEHFDVGGILAFDAVEELPAIVASLSADLYHRMLPAAARNFEQAGRYVDPLAWMWRHGIADAVEQRAARTLPAAVEEEGGQDAELGRERGEEGEGEAGACAAVSMVVVVPVVGGVARRWGERSLRSVVEQRGAAWRLRVVAGEGEEEEARAVLAEVLREAAAEGRRADAEVVRWPHGGGKVTPLGLLLEGLREEEEREEEVVVLVEWGDWLMHTGVLAFLARQYSRTVSAPPPRAARRGGADGAEGAGLLDDVRAGHRLSDRARAALRAGAVGGGVGAELGAVPSAVAVRAPLLLQGLATPAHHRVCATADGGGGEQRGLLRALHGADLTLGASAGLAAAAAAASRADPEYRRLKGGGGAGRGEYADSGLQPPFWEPGLVLPLLELAGPGALFANATLYVLNLPLRKHLHRHPGILGNIASAEVQRLPRYQRLPGALRGLAGGQRGVRIVRPEDTEEFVVGAGCVEGGGGECEAATVEVAARGLAPPLHGCIRGSINDVPFFRVCDAHFSLSIPLSALPTSAYTVSIELSYAEDAEAERALQELMEAEGEGATWQLEDFVTFFVRREGEELPSQYQQVWIKELYTWDPPFRTAAAIPDFAR